MEERDIPRYRQKRFIYIYFSYAELHFKIFFKIIPGHDQPGELPKNYKI